MNERDLALGVELEIPSRLHAWLGAALLAASCALLAARFLAFDEALEVASALLGRDGSVSAANRAAFAATLLIAAAAMSAGGALFMATGHSHFRRRILALIGWDALAAQGLRVPRADVVFVASSALGIGFVALWLLSPRLGSPWTALFVKEGPAELLTFLLEISAAALCVGAAFQWKLRDPPSLKAVPVLFGLCALLLFLVGMEEINWGQTLLGFKTPQAWAVINHQQETSLHNLLDRDALTWGWRLVAVGFGIGSVLLVALSVRLPRSVLGAIAPPASLLVLALVAAYSGARIHPELIELLLSVFFAFYGYRAYVAARSSRHPFDRGVGSQRSVTGGQR